MAPSSQLAAFALDDFETRAGSATSVLRTIAGLYLRHFPGPLPRQQVIDLAVAAGLQTAAARTALSRLLEKNLFAAHGAQQVAVTSNAQAMFARGNRRIFTAHQMGPEDPWLLVSYSVPEARRALRHQLRKHFTQLGGGMVNAGLWIFPGHLEEEVGEAIEALEASSFAFCFQTSATGPAPLDAQRAAQWWDLERLAGQHRQFLRTARKLEQLPAQQPAQAYRDYIELVDAWRAIPYLDPGLHPQLLPPDWPGAQSTALFASLSQRLEPAALNYVRSVMGAVPESGQAGMLEP